MDNESIRKVQLISELMKMRQLMAEYERLETMHKWPEAFFVMNRMAA
ncbi:MAG: hypothetical protein SVM80_00560 [Halobacteriota archaeon]|nr:hypothetical protein [Halobacteriota archaeon]